MTLPACRLIYGTAGIDLAVPRRTHLRNLELAWSEGISHFDTAPIYAHGQAETILGEFLKNCPDAKVTTKMGLNGRFLPRMPASVFRLARCGARMFVKSRGLASDAISSAPAENTENSNDSMLPTLDLIGLRQSLDGSLRRLRLDSVPILLLHEVSLAAANHPLVVEFMEGLHLQGMFQKAGIGGGNPAVDCGILDPVYQVLQSEFFLGGRSWPETRVPAHRENIVYAALRPMKMLSAHLFDQGLAAKWRRELDSSLAGQEGIAVWLVSWALYHLPQSRAVFFSGNSRHIQDMARGVESLLADSKRLTVFDSLYRSLSL